MDGRSWCNYVPPQGNFPVVERRSILGNADVFVYTGQDGNNAPQNVVRVLVDPSITSREGLVEIGEDSFACCEHAITKIIIGFVNLPSHARFELQFSFTTTLRALEEAHSLAAYLPTSEFLPSSQ